MNLEEASHRVEPVRMFTRNGGNFYRVRDGNEKPSGNDFSTSRTLKEVARRTFIMYSAPRGTYILASVLHCSSLRHVRRRIDFCVISCLPLFLSFSKSSFKAAGFKIYRVEPRGINLQDEQWLKNSLVFRNRVPKYDGIAPPNLI